VQLPFDHRICLGCMGLAIGKLQNAVYNHRPTNTNMQTAIDDAVRPLTERIATPELEMSALRQAALFQPVLDLLDLGRVQPEGGANLLIGSPGHQHFAGGLCFGLGIGHLMPRATANPGGTALPGSGPVAGIGLAKRFV
jgi:hypothetical protein